MSQLGAHLKTLADGFDLAALEAAFAVVMDGEASAEATKAFLAVTIPYMAEPRALAAGARALRARMARIEAPPGAIDVCGTGGDGAHTLNISTSVAFIVAGAGVIVAKHGNRAMSSKSGAADVLEALGVRLTADRASLERCLAEANVAFLFAQNHHPAMRHVAAARRELGVRTIFNLLGPLSNPAGVTRQLVGVFAADWVSPVAHALLDLGAEGAWVVHGAGRLDELVVGAGNLGARLSDGAVVSAPVERAGAHDAEGLRGGSAAENAAALLALLDGDVTRPAYRDAAAFNAAAALVVSGACANLDEGWAAAIRSLESGAARERLDTLVAVTKDAP